jgi:hypothetical protein
LRTAWKAAVDSSRLNLDSYLKFIVLGVKVRRRVGAVIHANDNPKKSRNFGHEE